MGTLGVPGCGGVGRGEAEAAAQVWAPRGPTDSEWGLGKTVRRRGGPPLLAQGCSGGPGTMALVPTSGLSAPHPSLPPDSALCRAARPLRSQGPRTRQPPPRCETRGPAHVTGSRVPPHRPPAGVPSPSLTRHRHVPPSCPQPWPAGHRGSTASLPGTSCLACGLRVPTPHPASGRWAEPGQDWPCDQSPSRCSCRWRLPSSGPALRFLERGHLCPWEGTAGAEPVGTTDPYRHGPRCIPRDGVSEP